jgi:hypothetical protein
MWPFDGRAAICCGGAEWRASRMHSGSRHTFHPCRQAMRFFAAQGSLGTIGGESAWVSGLEDPLTSREPTAPPTGCREEETANSPDMVDKPPTRVLIQRRSAVGVSTASERRFAGCRVLSSLASPCLGAVKAGVVQARDGGCWDHVVELRVQKGEQSTAAGIEGRHEAAMRREWTGRRPARCYSRRSRNIVRDSSTQANGQRRSVTRRVSPGSVRRTQQRGCGRAVFSMLSA